MAELRGIVAYIRQSDAIAAEHVALRIEELASLLGSHPELGRPTKWDRSVRKLVISGTRYILIYELKDGSVEILTVFHSRRAPLVRFT